MEVEAILRALEASFDPAALQGMARYGIRTERAFGIGLPLLRDFARQVGRDHKLAQALWRSGYREARLLATLLADPAAMTPAEMDRWAGDCDSWDVCDGLCNNLLRRTRYAYEKAEAWSAREEPFVKRAGFVLMAALAVHDKGAEEARFLGFLRLVERQADDDRNFVRKAVSWALRQIGKRSQRLRGKAIVVAGRLARSPSRGARWVGKDALRDLR